MSGKLPGIDCQELIRALESAGFVRKRQKGSYRACSQRWRYTIGMATGGTNGVPMQWGGQPPHRPQRADAAFGGAAELGAFRPLAVAKRDLGNG